MNPLAAPLLQLIWPVSCPGCGRLGEALCGPCLAALLRPAPPRCLHCGGPAPCPRHPDAQKIYPASHYKGKVPDVIGALKYLGLRAAGPRLGEGMARLWGRPEGLMLLLPVPLHRGSVRGYNQAFEIARGMGRVWDLPALDLARWTRAMPPRMGLSWERRKALGPSAFRVPRLAGLSIALVDDVCTTGATLSCLTAACGAAGAQVRAAYTASST